MFESLHRWSSKDSSFLSMVGFVFVVALGPACVDNNDLLSRTETKTSSLCSGDGCGLDQGPGAGQPKGAPLVSRHVRVPGFDVGRFGFHFANAFPAVPDVTLDLGTAGKLKLGDASKGLCGGMAFAARDAFERGCATPADTDPPSSGPLFDYIVRRLIDSFDLPTGVARYLWLMDPDLPDHETEASQAGLAPHGRSWLMIEQEWPLIRSDLDAGHPVPLGLVEVKSHNPADLGQNHQVLAYGYDLIGSSLKIVAYDPNFPDTTDIGLALDVSDPTRTIVSVRRIPSLTAPGPGATWLGDGRRAGRAKRGGRRWRRAAAERPRS